MKFVRQSQEDHEIHRLVTEKKRISQIGHNKHCEIRPLVVLKKIQVLSISCKNTP